MMSDEVYNHFELSGMTQTEFVEFLKETFPEFGDLEAEDVLLQQESVLTYIEKNRQYSDVTSDYGQTSNRSLSFAHESELSYGESNESQLALDEALARSLQDLGDDFNDLHIPEHVSSAHENTGSSFRETPARSESQQIRQDDIDPDSMTYEELQSLGESVGSESKGLSPALISRLPSFKYKAGFFSKKKKEKEECVICCSEYKNGAEVTNLPCAHNYHSKCINHWLQLKKHCPVCQKEVEDE